MKKKVITFDCYGTLLDTASFEEELGRIAEENGLNPTEIQALFACNEARMMYAEPFRRLDTLIPAILERCDMQLGAHCMARYGERMIEAQKALRPFPEVLGTLQILKKRGYSLALMSNSCHTIMAGNAAALGSPFEQMVLAEDVRAYKPQLSFFEMAESVLDLKNAQHCHVAQGYFYDVIPAAQMGWKRLWINRCGELGNPAQQPYTEVRSLEQILPLFPAC
ncbi:MAG: HAD hydrolase-like protein [Candidatus Pelethousia sp.]|nr:HAD hydrolase-like protein [Candidatus Pelethousia sp.]